MAIVDNAQSVTPTASPTLLTRFREAIIGKRLVAVLKRLQCARMREVLSKLSDEQLAEIGLRRKDIPAYAYRLIYEAE